MRGATEDFQRHGRGQMGHSVTLSLAGWLAGTHLATLSGTFLSLRDSAG